ncbi:hemolysin secretion protein D [Alishewanella longhuensis]
MKGYQVRSLMAVFGAALTLIGCSEPAVQQAAPPLVTVKLSEDEWR